MTGGKWAGERFHTPITLGSVPRTGLIRGTRSELVARRAKGAGLKCPRLRESTAILEFVTSYTPGWRPAEPDGVNTPQHSDRVPDGAPAEPDVDGQFIKYVGFCVPRRWVTPETMDLDGMVAEIEEIVRTRGLVAPGEKSRLPQPPLEEAGNSRDLVRRLITRTHRSPGGILLSEAGAGAAMCRHDPLVTAAADHQPLQ
jgi:hypothetical protein